MFEVKSMTNINAPIDIVWQTLMDVDSYKMWSTMLHYEGGTIAKDETITLRLTLPNGTDYQFSPKVVDLQPNKRFAWKATTFINGIFDGEHIFELEAVNDNTTCLTNREVYSGILSPIFKQLPMMKEAPAGFDAMNAEIKAQAETSFSGMSS